MILPIELGPLKGHGSPSTQDGEAAQKLSLPGKGCAIFYMATRPGGRILDRLLLARPRVSGPPRRVGELSLARRHGVAVESRPRDALHQAQCIDACGSSSALAPT